MRGRPPKPTTLKVMEGNPGKRPLPKDEPQPKSGLPKAPRTLGKVGRDAWRRIGAELVAMGVMTEADRFALEALCLAWQRWREAEAMIDEFGALVRHPKTGLPVRNPALEVAGTERATVLRLLSEFGLTPAARTRVKTAKPKAKDDPKAARKARFFGAGAA